MMAMENENSHGKYSEKSWNSVKCYRGLQDLSREKMVMEIEKKRPW